MYAYFYTLLNVKLYIQIEISLWMYIFLYISVLWSKWAANHRLMPLSEVAGPRHKQYCRPSVFSERRIAAMMLFQHTQKEEACPDSQSQGYLRKPGVWKCHKKPSANHRAVWKRGLQHLTKWPLSAIKWWLNKMVAPLYVVGRGSLLWGTLGKLDGAAGPASQTQGTLSMCGVWCFTKWRPHRGRDGKEME